MAQQPNIEIGPSDLPRPALRPDASKRWRPEQRPGMITSPEMVPRGEGFGTPGPDTGWAITLIRRSDLPGHSQALEKVLAALMGARASSFGRAPTLEDLEVARLVCGMDPTLPDELRERARRWADAVPHERPPGKSALADVGLDVLRETPTVVRLWLTRSE